MNSTIAVGITLLLATVSGMALWGNEADRGRRGDGPRVDAVALVATAKRPAAEEELATSLLRLLDGDQRTAALLATRAGPAVMLRAAVAPHELGAQRGLPWSAMDAAQRAIVACLLQRCVGAEQDVGLAGLAGPALDEMCFAWAGPEDGSGAVYFRLHGARFVVEFHRPAGSSGGSVAFRDFARDARQPWFREQFQNDRR